MSAPVPDIERARLLVGEIAATCACGDVVIPELEEASLHDALMVLHRLVQRAGLVADMAAAALGSEPFRRAIAEDWIKP